jgi:hypothetical protein
VKTRDLEHNPDFFKGNSTQKRSTWQRFKNMAGFGGAPKLADAKKDELHLQTTVAAATAHEEANVGRYSERFY